MVIFEVPHVPIPFLIYLPFIPEVTTITISDVSFHCMFFII